MDKVFIKMLDGDDEIKVAEVAQFAGYSTKQAHTMTPIDMDFVQSVKEADFIITDSGFTQGMTYIIGKPTLAVFDPSITAKANFETIEELAKYLEESKVEIW